MTNTSSKKKLEKVKFSGSSRNFVECSESAAILAPGERDARAPSGPAPQEKLKNHLFGLLQTVGHAHPTG